MPTADLEDRRPRFTALAAGAGDYTTTLVVADAIFEPRDIVMNTRTGECAIVAAVSGQAISCRRGVGSNAAPMVEGDELLRLGSAE